jgi:hypothetical protein
VEKVLKTIAKQANLDRVLFTPALKKVYFDMAVGSGGATQFKHSDGVRKGLNFIADMAGQEKQTLLFCSLRELVQGYDQLLRYANEMTPIMVLALRHVKEEPASGYWNIHDLGQTGWLQFHTHTLQELYDHLALGYHLFAEKKVKLPVMVIHSAASHQAAGDFTANESLNLGSPVQGFKAKKKTMDFDAALKAMKEKKEKPTLPKLYQNIVETLRAIYTDFGYTVPEAGFPYIADEKEGETAIITSIPPEDNDPAFTRLLTYRPFFVGGVLESLQKKNTVAVVEPQPAPGVTVPPFYGELRGLLPSSYSGNLVSICIAENTGLLTKEQIKQIHKTVTDPKDIPSKTSFMVV